MFVLIAPLAKCGLLLLIIVMLLLMLTKVGPRNHVLDRVQFPIRERSILRAQRGRLSKPVMVRRST